METWGHTQREDSHVKREAETGVMQIQGKQRLGSLIHQIISIFHPLYDNNLSTGLPVSFLSLLQSALAHLAEGSFLYVNQIMSMPWTKRMQEFSSDSERNTHSPSKAYRSNTLCPRQRLLFRSHCSAFHQVALAKLASLLLVLHSKGL